ASRHRTNCRTRWCRNLRWPPPSATSCAGRRFGHGTASRGTPDHFTDDAADALGEQFGLAQMHALAERIAHLQHADDLVGKRLDHGNLEPEPEIPDLGAERPALIELRFGPHR